MPCQQACTHVNLSFVLFYGVKFMPVDISNNQYVDDGEQQTNIQSAGERGGNDVSK